MRETEIENTSIRSTEKLVMTQRKTSEGHTAAKRANLKTNLHTDTESITKKGKGDSIPASKFYVTSSRVSNLNNFRFKETSHKSVCISGDFI